MFLNRRIKLNVLLQFAWRVQLWAFLLSAFVFILYEYFDFKALAIPFLPVATIGTAVAFYVGFKNNSAYDRLWEARRVWGSITNASRMWVTMAKDFPGSRMKDVAQFSSIKQALIYRHLAWVNLLRLQLRKSPVFNENSYRQSAQFQIIRSMYGTEDFEKMKAEVLAKYLSEDERKQAASHSNTAAFILNLQHSSILHCKNSGLLDEFEHREMNSIILELYNQQGACERIKSFPFPRQYASFSVVFVYIFIALLPFAMISDLDKLGYNTAWLVIPFTMLIAWIFNLMEQVGDASENPFDNGINDVPMTAICRNLEIEFRELLGEKEIPARIEPVNGILM